MEPGRTRSASVRTQFLSPFRHIFKPRVEDLTKKPITIGLLTSYLRYRKHPLSGNFKENLRVFLKSLTGKENTSSLLNTLKNFMEQKKINTRNYKLIKRTYAKNNNNNFIINSINKSNKFNKNDTAIISKKIYKKRYKYLIQDLSSNGNNSQSSFKNITNNMLDSIFNFQPFVSFDKENIKIVSQKPKKYQLFFKNINNKSKEFDYSKESSLSLVSKNNNFKKEKNINNKVFFENKVLNKLSQRKEFNEAYSEKNNHFIDSKYLKFKLSNKTKENKNKTKTEFYNNFKNLKEKLKKKDESNNIIINDIKRQQSLTKYKIQVGIVKLNEYKNKIRRFNKMQSNKY
jgi:hypothetical protein